MLGDGRRGQLQGTPVAADHGFDDERLAAGDLADRAERVAAGRCPGCRRPSRGRPGRTGPGRGRGSLHVSGVRGCQQALLAAGQADACVEAGGLGCLGPDPCRLLDAVGLVSGALQGGTLGADPGQGPRGEPRGAVDAVELVRPGRRGLARSASVVARLRAAR